MQPNEYGLRLTLAFEPGQVFSRQDLLANDWNDDTNVDERTVDFQTIWFRGKLAEAGLDGQR